MEDEVILMGWPKGRSRSEAEKHAISNGLLNGKVIKKCENCGAEIKTAPSHVRAGKGRWCSPECRNTGQTFLMALKKRTNDPAWRKRMSEQTREGWKNPLIREIMIEGQQANFEARPNGSNFPVGIPQTELDYVNILCPAGYVTSHIIPTRRPENNGGGYYKLDYAHVEARVNIEIDGSSHRFNVEKDARRDAFLRALGWKVIRIKV